MPLAGWSLLKVGFGDILIWVWTLLWFARRFAYLLLLSNSEFGGKMEKMFLLNPKFLDWISFFLHNISTFRRKLFHSELMLLV